MLENDEGADFLPMRLIAVLIVAVLALAVAAIALTDAVGLSSKAAARACAARIVAMATSEYANSCPDRSDGARFEAYVPGCVCTMAFGLAAEVEGSTPSEDEHCLCRLQFADGCEETVLAGVPLGAGGPLPGRGEPLVLYPGQYDICVRAETVNGSVMALIYAEAA